MLYEVLIKETLEKVISIKAANKKEALDIAEEKYNNEDIVLDSNDYTGVTIKIL